MEGHSNNERVGEPVLRELVERVSVAQLGEEKGLRRPYSTFQYLKGSTRNLEGLLSRVCSGRTRGSGFKLSE